MITKQTADFENTLSYGKCAVKENATYYYSSVSFKTTQDSSVLIGKFNM